MSVVKLEAPDLEEGVAPLSPIILTSPIPHRRRRVRVRVPRTVRRIVGPLIVLILWQVVCSAGVFTSFEVASPIAVFDAGRELAVQGVLLPNLLISLRRVLEGLGLGVGIGVTLAVLSVSSGRRGSPRPGRAGGSRGTDSWPGSVGDHLVRCR